MGEHRSRESISQVNEVQGSTDFCQNQFVCIQKVIFLESAINVSSTERWGAWRAQLSGLYCPGKGFATAIVVLLLLWCRKVMHPASVNRCIEGGIGMATGPGQVFRKLIWLWVVSTWCVFKDWTLRPIVHVGGPVKPIPLLRPHWRLYIFNLRSGRTGGTVFRLGT